MTSVCLLKYALQPMQPIASPALFYGTSHHHAREQGASLQQINHHGACILVGFVSLTPMLNVRHKCTQAHPRHRRPALPSGDRAIKHKSMDEPSLKAFNCKSASLYIRQDQLFAPTRQSVRSSHRHAQHQRLRYHTSSILHCTALHQTSILTHQSHLIISHSSTSSACSGTGDLIWNLYRSTTISA